MNVAFPRTKLERFGKLLQEYRRRQAKADQSQRGWYDDNGVRQGGLIAFVRYFWHILEPETPLVDGWPLWAICEHLEAVTAGEVTRLLINVPPGFMKSMLVDVFWPAWEWGPMDMAHVRYVAFAYAAHLTERDNRRFRALVMSTEYQTLYKDRVKIIRKGDVQVGNAKHGWKFASSVTGVGTGERGDRIILDDPHNVIEGESETVRNETVRWFREAMSNRMNNPNTGVIVIIMQRVHAEDVSGVILDLKLPYCHLMIPMEYAWDRQTYGETHEQAGQPIANTLGWVDPRYVPTAPDECDGVLAWEERFSAETCARMKIEVGPHAWAGQYQQTPKPRGASIFNPDWWQLWESPTGRFPELEYVVGSLDGAFTEKEENDPCALTIWGVFRSDEARDMGGPAPMVLGGPRIILLHAWRKHLKFSGPRIERLSVPTIIGGKQWPADVLRMGMDERDKARCNAWYRRRTMPHWGLMEWTVDSCNKFKVDLLLIEAKANGISAAHELQNRYGLQDWSIQLCPVKGDKVARALAVQPTFSQLMVYAPDRDWADIVIEEMEVFPKGKHDDLTDSATQAMKYLRDSGLARTDEEVHASAVERVTHRPRTRNRPLYPV